MLSRIRERWPFGGAPPAPYMSEGPDPMSEPEAEGAPETIEAPRDLPEPSMPAQAGSDVHTVIAERDALLERLRRLEQMLADPEKCQNAILYYRLRAIWRLCHKDLVVLATQFREKYEARSAQAVARGSSEERIAIAARLRRAAGEEKTLREEVARLHRRLHDHAKPFKVGEKALLTHDLQEREQRLKQTRMRVAALRQEAAIMPPAAPRAMLSVGTRRAINTLLIALAQHYYLHYRDEQIADMALRAMRKPVDEAYFGLTGECLALQRKTRELVALAKGETNRHEAVRRRAQYLHERLRYPDTSSAIPLKESLNSIPSRLAADEELFANLGEIVPVNVLAEDYWDLNRALLP